MALRAFIRVILWCNCSWASIVRSLDFIRRLVDQGLLKQFCSTYIVRLSSTVFNDWFAALRSWVQARANAAQDRLGAHASICTVLPGCTCEHALWLPGCGCEHALWLPGCACEHALWLSGCACEYALWLPGCACTHSCTPSYINNKIILVIVIIIDPLSSYYSKVDTAALHTVYSSTSPIQGARHEPCVRRQNWVPYNFKLTIFDIIKIDIITVLAVDRRCIYISVNA